MENYTNFLHIFTLDLCHERAHFLMSSSSTNDHFPFTITLLKVLQEPDQSLLLQLSFSQPNKIIPQIDNISQIDHFSFYYPCPTICPSKIQCHRGYNFMITWYSQPPSHILTFPVSQRK